MYQKEDKPKGTRADQKTALLTKDTIQKKLSWLQRNKQAAEKRKEQAQATQKKRKEQAQAAQKKRKEQAQAAQRNERNKHKQHKRNRNKQSSTEETFSAEARLELQYEQYKKTLKELEEFYSENPEYLEFEQY